MIILIYFIISLAGGIVPAFIAKQKHKRFILWWIYGTLFLPVALLHSILLLFNAKKGVIIVRTLLIVYGLVIFYFITWAVSTQPAAAKWYEIGENKYTLGKTLYDNTDEVTALISNIVDYFSQKTDYDRAIINKAFSGFDNEKLSNITYIEVFKKNKEKEADTKVKESIWTQEEADTINAILGSYIKLINPILATNFLSVQDFMEEKTGIEREIIDDTFAYFENEKHIDREYVQTFAIDLIKSVANVYKITTDKGAYEDWSVPMGDAKQIFTLYLQSLKDLNIIFQNNPVALESNYKSYLKAESTYLKTTTIVDEYKQHLDKEREKNIDNERKLALISHYDFIGDCLAGTQQNKAADEFYDTAITLYEEIMSRTDLSAKLKTEYLFEIGNIDGKKHDIDKVINVFKKYLAVFFGEGLFMDDDAIYDLEAYIKIEIIEKNIPNLIRILNTFTDFINNFATTKKNQLCIVENKILITFFPQLPQAEREQQTQIIQENYNYLISPMNIETISTIKEAFETFDRYDFKFIAQSYLENLEGLVPEIKSRAAVIKNTDSINFEKEIDKATEYVEGIFIKETLIDSETSEELIKLQKSIREDTKKVLEEIIQIKDSISDIEKLMKHLKGSKAAKKKLESEIKEEKIKMSVVQSIITKSTKEFNDIVRDIKREKEIITKEYDVVMAQIIEAQDMGEKLGLVPPGQRKTMKKDMMTLRDKIKNEVGSLSIDIDNIITSKNNIAEKYNTESHSERLAEIKGKLVTLKNEIDAVIEKYFPGELAAKEEAEKK